jgi:hypothetical protein
MKYGRLDGKEASERGYLPAIVLLNGKPISDCVVFDDIEGWADVYDRDKKGQIVIDESGDQAKIKRIYGEIEYKPNTKREDLS